jgi:stage II sporulation protein AA (anti-sigma F factor antagonist)
MTGPKETPPDGPTFRLDTCVGDSETVLRLYGEGDLVAAPVLRGALSHTRSKGRPPVVVLDLSGLTFVDASFLAVIARHRECADIHQIVLRAPTPFVARVLDIVGWNDLVEPAR